MLKHGEKYSGGLENLVDIFLLSREEETQRVCAIVDNQSNASMITTELADCIGAQGPKEKYFLFTCSRDREVKYGRRIPGLIVCSTTGKMSKLPMLIECNHILQSKEEIRESQEFTYLRDTVDEITPIDDDAGIHILTGCDAPELLKVQSFQEWP